MNTAPQADWKPPRKQPQAMPDAEVLQRQVQPRIVTPSETILAKRILCASDQRRLAWIIRRMQQIIHQPSLGENPAIESASEHLPASSCMCKRKPTPSNQTDAASGWMGPYPKTGVTDHRHGRSHPCPRTLRCPWPTLWPGLPKKAPASSDPETPILPRIHLNCRKEFHASTVGCSALSRRFRLRWIVLAYL